MKYALFLAYIFCGYSACCAGDVYRCNKDGAIVFSDTPCGDNATLVIGVPLPINEPVPQPTATYNPLDTRSMAIGKWTNRKSGSYYYVEGIVTNNGKENVKFSKIKLFCLDRWGDLVTLEEAYVDPTLLTPGQEGTFKLLVKDNDKIDTFKIRLEY